MGFVTGQNTFKIIPERRIRPEGPFIRGGAGGVKRKRARAETQISC